MKAGSRSGVSVRRRGRRGAEPHQAAQEGLGGRTEDASGVNWRNPPGREPRRRQPPEQPDRPGGRLATAGGSAHPTESRGRGGPRVCPGGRGPTQARCLRRGAHPEGLPSRGCRGDAGLCLPTSRSPAYERRGRTLLGDAAAWPKALNPSLVETVTHTHPLIQYPNSPKLPM